MYIKSQGHIFKKQRSNQQTSENLLRFHKEIDYFIAGDETWKRKRDMFASWSNYWRVFYPFFYRGKTKETVQLYLEQIGKRLLQDLEIPDYTIHTVDFQGMQNFGSDYRRFAFINLQPEFGGKFVEFLQNDGISKTTIEFIRSSIGKVNQEIASDINLPRFSRLESPKARAEPATIQATTRAEATTIRRSVLKRLCANSRSRKPKENGRDEASDIF